MPDPMYGTKKQKPRYAKAAILDCLNDGFDETEMKSLCLENEVFDEKWKSYAGIPFGEKITRLVDFAEMQSMFPELLALIKVKNPRQYEAHKNDMVKTTEISSEGAKPAESKAIGTGSGRVGQKSRLRLDVESLALHVDLLEDIESLLDRLPRFVERLDAEILESRKAEWGDPETYLRLTNKLIPEGKETISTLNTYTNRIKSNSDKLLYDTLKAKDNLNAITEHTTMLETVHGHFRQCLPTFSEDCDDLIQEDSSAIRRRIRKHLLTLRRAVVEDRIVDNTKKVQGNLYNGIRFLVADLAQEVGLEKDYST